MKSYGKLCTQYYDLDKPHPPAEAFSFYLNQARSADGPILEPMCGSGRFLLPLIQAGVTITGVDPSPAMLAACQKKALTLGLNPSLYQQFLHAMDLPGIYRLAVIPSGSFGLITDTSEALQSLHKLHQHLVSGGRLVLALDQLLTEPAAEPAPGENILTRPEGGQIKITSSGKFDSANKIYCSANRYELILDGKVVESEIEEFNLRYYQPEQFTALLSECGFKRIQVQAAFDPRLPLKAADSLIFIAHKP